MTVSYHAGRRIQGLSTEGMSTVTFEDDFSTDNATDLHSANIGVTGGKWEFDFKRDGTNDASAIDLGSALSDSKWAMDFDFYLNAVTLGNLAGFLGVSNEDETSSRSGTTKHSVFMCISGGASGSTDDNIFLSSTYNSSMGNSESGGDPFSLTTDNADLTTHYCRMSRDGTVIKLIFYTSSARTSVSETLTHSINASATGLQYIVLHNFDNLTGGSGTLTGYIDNIKIYDGITSVVSTVQRPTNVQAGSRFEETDTRKVYDYNAPSVTWEHDYADSTGWTEVGTTTNITGGVWTSNSAGNNGDHGFYKALGFTLSDSAWYCEFDIKQTGSALESGMPLFFSAGTAKPLDTSHDALGITAANAGAVQAWKNTAGTGGTGTGATALTVDVQYYGVLIRTSSTNLRIKYYTDAARTVQHGSDSNLTVDAGITALDTIQHRATDNGGTASGTSNIIDNVKIYNGVTSPDNTWQEIGA